MASEASKPTYGDTDWVDTTNNWTAADAEWLQDRAIGRYEDTAGSAPSSGFLNLGAGRLFYGANMKGLILAIGSSVFKNILASRYIKQITDGTGTADIVATNATTGIHFTDGSSAVGIPSLTAVVRQADAGTLVYDATSVTDLPAGWVSQTVAPLRSNLPSAVNYPDGTIFIIN